MRDIDPARLKSGQKPEDVPVVALFCSKDKALQKRVTRSLTTWWSWCKVSPRSVAAFTLLPDSDSLEVSGVVHIDWGGSATLSRPSVISFVVASHG